MVDRLRSGDADAFAEVARTWSPMMLQVARAHVSTDASAQEVVQDTWLAMIRGLDEVSFTVHSDRLAFTGRTLERIVEPGEVRFRVGTAGSTFVGPVAVQLTGATRTIRGERVMDTPTAVSNAR